MRAVFAFVWQASWPSRIHHSTPANTIRSCLRCGNKSPTRWGQRTELCCAPPSTISSVRQAFSGDPSFCQMATNIWSIQNRTYLMTFPLCRGIVSQMCKSFAGHWPLHRIFRAATRVSVLSEFKPTDFLQLSPQPQKKFKFKLAPSSPSNRNGRRAKRNSEIVNSWKCSTNWWNAICADSGGSMKITMTIRSQWATNRWPQINGSQSFPSNARDQSKICWLNLRPKSKQRREKHATQRFEFWTNCWWKIRSYY